MPKTKYLLFISLAILLIAPALMGVNNSAFNVESGSGNPISTLSQTSHIQTTTYGIGLGGGPVIMDVNALTQMAGGTTVHEITTMIQEYLVPLNVHFVFMDPGWSAVSANTSSAYVLGGFQQWVANWLQASAPFGIKTAFFFLQWGYLNTGWTVSFLNEYPHDKTVNNQGQYVAPSGSTDVTLSAFGIADSQDVLAQMKEDLNQLYQWYGQYGDWVGFGEGSTGDRNYYAPLSNAIQTSRPWDNGTLDVFANSVFFQRTINSSGYYLGTSTLSKIWSEFLNDRPDISISSGVPGLSSYPVLPVYGNNVVLERFAIPAGTTLNGFKLFAYLSTTGSPSTTLVETIYPDNSSNVNGKPVFDKPVASQTVSGISSTAGWVSTTFSNTVLAESNYYWVAFTTTGGDANDYYNAYEVGQPVQSDIYSYLSTSGLSGATRNPSSSILWIQSLSGQTVTVYPYVNGGALLGMNPGNTFYLETPTQININMLAFFTSDRAYDTYNTTMTLEYPNGTSLATGAVSEALMNGAQGLDYFPFQLSSIVTLYPNIKYQVAFSSLSSSDNYAGSAKGGISQDILSLTANPPSAGYLGQTQWPLFQAGLMTIENNSIGSNMNYESATDLGASPGYKPGFEIAMRFEATQPETFQNFSVNVIRADSSSASFQVTLRPDNTTCLAGSGVCSHPSNFSSVLASGSISLSAINSTFIGCPTTTGKCTFANVTLTGSTSLSANTYYWLVMNVTQNQGVVLERLVSPYRNLVYGSANDFSTTWGVPPDGPTDLSYRIVTSGDVINNTVLGQAGINLGATVAQSFGPTTAFQLKGLWLYASTGGVANLNVSIESDSGGDSPSGSILVSGIIPNFGPGLSFNYVSLNIPVNLTASTKYWIVVSADCIDKCSGGTPKAYADVFESDYPGAYGGSGLYHYETSSGSTWTSPAQRGSMDFILAGSDSTINTYNTSTLYNEISAHEANSYSGSSAILPLQGWNSFLNYEQSSIMYNLTQYMQSTYGQHMYWLTGMTSQIRASIPGYNSDYVLSGINGASGPIGCDPSNAACGGDTTAWLDDSQNFVNGILSSTTPQNQLPQTSLGNDGDNGGDLTSPNDLLNQYLLLPLMDSGGTLTYNDWSFGNSGAFKGLDNLTVTSYIRNDFGPILSRMSNNGGYFGTSKDAVRVLWIGSQSSGGDGFFPEFLTPAVNLTLSTVEDSNQTAYGNLSQFKVIVGYPNNPTQSFIQRYDTFVKNGGGAVLLSMSASPSGNNYVMGYDVTSNGASRGSSLSIVTPNPITNPYTSVNYSPYWMRYQTIPLANETPTIFVQDSNGNPIITANKYFNGIGVNIEEPWDSPSHSGNAQVFDGLQYGSPSDSFVSILINAIYYAAGDSSMLPILWESSYSQQNWSPYIQFSIDGSPGKPVLLWLSSNSSSSSQFSINLNANFYGISTQGWVAINMENMEVVASGTGSDIGFSTTIPAYSWEPIYIMNDTSSSNLQPLYSTATVLSSSASGSSSSFSLDGALNSSSWLVLSSTSPMSAVSSSLTGSIPSYSSLSSLNQTQIGYFCTTVSASVCSSWTARSQQGYYYDSTKNLLYIHYMGGSAATLSVSSSTSSTTSSSTTTTATTASTQSSTSSTTSSSTTTTATTASTQSSTSSTTSSSTTTTATTASTQSSTSSTTSSSTTTNSTTTSTTQTTTATSSSNGIISSTSKTATLGPTSTSTTSQTTTPVTTSSTTQSSSTTTNSSQSTTSASNSSQSSTATQPNNSGALFGFIPFQGTTPTPLGTAIIALLVASVTAAPFVVRKVAKRAKEKGEDSRGWRW